MKLPEPLAQELLWQFLVSNEVATRRWSKIITRISQIDNRKVKKFSKKKGAVQKVFFMSFSSSG
jgi:hypothetical protein